jgi:alkanesulfonate monooxygenase SsuD/methylene tetrahydromethanopterin reductase-like flavin-dependent oxidoreductase (luciferase family)
MWMAAGAPDSIRQVAERGFNLLLDQFASFETVAERIATFKAAVDARGRAFDPMDIGVARAFYVAKDQADKEAALERRLEAQRRLAAVSNAPDGSKSKASIMAFSDTREASEESALYGTPDEIARKLENLQQLGVGYVLLNGGAGAGQDSLRRFAHEVMPAFGGAARARVVG